jgi:penicillin-binding protein 1A
MRRSLALSRNLASINLLQSVGLEEAQNYIRRFGFDTQALPLGLSMVLGTGELSPVKLAEGYAVFANGGYHVTPYFIQRIEDGDGQVVFEAQVRCAPVADCWYKTGDTSAATRGLAAQGQGLAERVIDPRTAYQMTSLLREVIERGTGTRAKKLDRPDVVGKTGTTNDIRDSWFAGYQAEFVTIAWMGFDDFGKLGRGEEGGKAALGLWVDFMEQALKDRPVATLEPPPDSSRCGSIRLVALRPRPRAVSWSWCRKSIATPCLVPEPVRVAKPVSGTVMGRAGVSDSGQRYGRPRVMRLQYSLLTRVLDDFSRSRR